MISISLSYMIFYLNLFSMGYKVWDFVYFIIRRPECLLLLVTGLVIITYIRWGRDINELFLRRYR